MAFDFMRFVGPDFARVVIVIIFNDFQIECRLRKIMSMPFNILQATQKINTHQHQLINFQQVHLLKEATS